MHSIGIYHARHLGTSTFTLPGSLALMALDWPWCGPAGVALMALGWLCRRCLCGRRGAWPHRPSLCLASVPGGRPGTRQHRALLCLPGPVLMALGWVWRHAWSRLPPLSLRLFAWALRLVTWTLLMALGWLWWLCHAELCRTVTLSHTQISHTQLCRIQLLFTHNL